MAFRGYTNSFLLLVMFLTQLALAQHAAVHFAPEGHTIALAEYGDGGNDHSPHKKQQSDKICQLCFFAKNFSQVVLAGSTLISQGVFEPSFIFSPAQNMHVQAIARAYQARAPPSLLI